MNLQYLVKLKSDDNEKSFTYTLPAEEHQILFHKYISIATRLQEIDQLFRMLLFNLHSLLRQYDLRFNDFVCNRLNKPVDPIELNALVCNAVSSAHTLVESLETFDRNYLLNTGTFKNNYISRIYDDCFSYRIVDTLRNFMQHGHIPISYDEIEGKVYFNLSEILDIQHMKMNAKLKNFLKEIEQQLLKSEDAMDTRTTCVFTLYEYFLQIHNLYAEFYSYAESELLKLVSDVRLVVSQHPEYHILGKNCELVASYIDEKDILHVFPADCKLDTLYKQNQIFAQTKYSFYKTNNGNLFLIKMRYTLENRIPLIRFVGDEYENKNLVEFCFEHFPDIRYISFDEYYGGMEMYVIHRLYPYIQFEDGLEWNVPYEEVRICDFLRTFPETRQQGIKAVANNVGGTRELFEFFMQQWNTFFIMAQTVLQMLDTSEFLNVIDWMGRATTILAVYRWLRTSFSKRKNRKPIVQCLLKYIKRQNSWNLCELADVLSAGKEQYKE